LTELPYVSIQYRLGFFIMIYYHIPARRCTSPAYSAAS
jgi:hypothetical protein